MTTLVVTSYRPDKPIGGAPLRNWQNIKALAVFGPVDVVSVGVEEAAEPVAEIRQSATFSLGTRSTWDRLKTACSPLRPGIYPGIDLYHSSAAASWIRSRAGRGRYDLGVIETISLAAYLPDLKWAAERVVFDAHNVESALHGAVMASGSEGPGPLARRLKQRMLHRRMGAEEARVVKGADLVWACSDVDAREIARAYGRRTGVTVVPNGVDVDEYQRGAVPPSDDWSRLPVTMVYPALFSYAPNEDAALRLIREVLPAVRARGCQARVVLLGRDPTPALIAAARAAEGVEVTGRVESVVPYLQQPCVVTLPIAMGGGTRLKILEAFAAGRPVVSTAKGAEGIDAADNAHLLIRDDAAAMADAVVELWRQPLLRQRLCATALELVRARYSWAVAARMIAQSLGIEAGRPLQSRRLSSDLASDVGSDVPSEVPTEAAGVGLTRPSPGRVL